MGPKRGPGQNKKEKQDRPKTRVKTGPNRGPKYAKRIAKTGQKRGPRNSQKSIKAVPKKGPRKVQIGGQDSLENGTKKGLKMGPTQAPIGGP